MKRKFAIDLTILVKTKTGTAVYARSVVEEIRKRLPPDTELITLHGPRSVPRRNFLTTVINGCIEMIWLNLLVPLIVLFRRVDVIHFPANIIPFFVPCKTVVTILDANFMRVPETYDYWWRTYARYQFTYAARHASRVITISETSKRDIVRYFRGDASKIEVIYLGRPPLGAPKALANPYGEYVLFVGGAYPSKNIPRLIRAFDMLLRTDDTGTNLVIAGGGGLDYHVIRELAKELSLDQRIHFTGHVSQDELLVLYSNARLFAFPSLNEGFGLPPIEAMAFGVPVVAARAGSLPEILGDAAVYFDPLSVEDICEKLRLVLRDEDLRGRMIPLARTQAERYSWVACAIGHLDVFSKVANSATGGEAS